MNSSLLTTNYSEKAPIYFKNFVIIVTLGILVYLNLNLLNNYTTDVFLRWRPDHQLTIDYIKNDEKIIYFEPKTLVLEIDGNIPLRGRPYLFLEHPPKLHQFQIQDSHGIYIITTRQYL